jgi:hypothetical protein
VQRAVKQLPEASSLGLGETPSVLAAGGATSSATTSPDPQLQLYTFNRLLMLQLQREFEAEAKFISSSKGSKHLKGSSPTLVSVSGTGAPQSSIVDDVFGFSVATTTTFLISGTKEVGAPHRALVLDLAYPVLKRPVSRKSLSPSSTAGKLFFGRVGPG